MEQTMQRIIRRLNTALKLGDLLASSAEQAAPAISDVRGRLQNILNRYEEASQLPEKEVQADRLRADIAAIRHEIHESITALEHLRSQSAESYRSRIGERKDAFEQMTEAEQQAAHSSAFEAKRMFHSLSDLAEVFELVSADLMTWSGELERRVNESKPIPDIGHYAVEDRTPAQPSLSP